MVHEQTDKLRTVIEAGDVAGVREWLVTTDHAETCVVVHDGRELHPVHFICDRIFADQLDHDRGVALAQDMIDRDLHLDWRHPDNNDSLLIGSISLGVAAVARRLIDAKVDPLARGLFDASAIYWAAIMGMPDVLQRLLPSEELYRRDTEFQCTPLGWAVERALSPPRGSAGEAADCAKLLVQAGSEVEQIWKSSAKVQRDPALASALGL